MDDEHRLAQALAWCAKHEAQVSFSHQHESHVQVLVRGYEPATRKTFLEAVAILAAIIDGAQPPSAILYKQMAFASRLEVRHAIFLDTLGIPYSYTQRRFFLPEHSLWLIITSNPTLQYVQEAKALTEQTRQIVCIFSTLKAAVGSYGGNGYLAGEAYGNPTIYESTRAQWGECAVCGDLRIVHRPGPVSSDLDQCANGHTNFNERSHRLIDACRVAQQAKL